jgi:hypothetical protein
MKKTLVALGILTTLLIGAQTSFAACPCENPCPCPCTESVPCPAPCPCAEATPCPTPCNKANCDDWLCKMETYYCRVGLSECQKAEARIAVAQFLCDTSRLNKCTCPKETKCDCRQYKRELKQLDCQMKKIITKCQKADYKCVKNEIKDQVKCCHKCLIFPFSLCKCDSCKCSCK